MATKLQIPEPFLFQPFYEQNASIEKGDTNAFFYYDIAYQLGLTEMWPWEDKKLLIPDYFAKWKELKEQLATIYETRNRKKARPYMLTALANLIDILFWTNGVPVHRLQQITDDLLAFTYKPVNIEERLSYLLSEVDHFHAYNQLKALYEELEKIYYKSMIGNY